MAIIISLTGAIKIEREWSKMCNNYTVSIVKWTYINLPGPHERLEMVERHVPFLHMAAQEH